MRGSIEFETCKVYYDCELPEISGNKIEVYTDGGARPSSSGKAGWALVISSIDGKKSLEYCFGFYRKSTNNRAELMAILMALYVTRGCRSVCIYSDSSYSIKCCTVWVENWKQRGWRNSAKKPVLNRDIIESIDYELQNRDVRFVKVKGHSSNFYNDLADELTYPNDGAYKNIDAPYEASLK